MPPQRLCLSQNKLKRELFENTLKSQPKMLTTFSLHQHGLKQTCFSNKKCEPKINQLQKQNYCKK
jgi:hypothetical protein